MKNNKKLFLFGIIFVIISICIIVVASIIFSKLKNTSINNNTENIKIYYYNKVNNTLSYEEKNISINDDNFINNIFEQMKIAPKSTSLQSVIPSDLELLDYTLDNSVLTVNLSNNYNNLSDTEKLIFRAGFVWSITEVNSINNVKILIDNEELKYANNKNIGYLNRDNIILNPIISPDKLEQEKIILYFANSDNKLVQEKRNIEANQNQSMEIHIIEELIAGPKLDGNIKTVPAETKIRNIKTEDNICYVDLSSDFINKISGNKEQESLAIYSIVNSLTNLSNVNKVQFLIDGEKTNLSKESVDISQPLGRYESIIQNIS